jgi:hypothetical protein
MSLAVIQAERLKQKGSLSSWLVITGAIFTPLVILVARIAYPKDLAKTYTSARFWEENWTTQWESMAILLIPMGIILAASLITQLEYKNNTWKQWHATPYDLLVLFSAKYFSLFLLSLQFFLLFNGLLWLTTMAVPLIYAHVPFPSEPLPWRFILLQNLHYFVHFLPMIALQFAISLLFRNFLVAIGAGILLWVLAIATLTWAYNYLNPYAHGSLYFLETSGRIQLKTDIVAWSLAYFVLFTISGYLCYLFRNEKS